VTNDESYIRQSVYVDMYSKILHADVCIKKSDNGVVSPFNP